MKKLLMTVLLLLTGVVTTASAKDLRWKSVDNQGQQAIHLYVYWSKGCPHCHEALQYLKRAESQYIWARIHRKEVTGNRQNLEEYNRMAQALGEPADVVPAFFFCGMMYAGYNGDSTGDWIFNTMKSCDIEQSEAGSALLPAQPLL